MDNIVEQNQFVIYRSPDGKVELNVKVENETIWLTQNQMAELFGVDRTSIVRHIRNIYKTGELEEDTTCVKNAQVRFEGGRKIRREILLYNLDTIISTGYRINSKNATAFRRWSTNILKQYIVKGYVVNQQRIDHYKDLKNIVHLMSRAVILQQETSLDEYRGLFCVINDYVYALDTLDKYDYQSLSVCKKKRSMPHMRTP